MKRIFLVALLAMLLVLPAQAEIWFPDGNNLHRDPICVKNAFTPDSTYAKVLRLTQEELEASGYLPCTHCCAYAAPAGETAVVSTGWYYNPAGGERLHQDAYCVSVAPKYHPLTSVNDASEGAILPETPCNICGGAWPRQLNYLFDNLVWNATPAQRAELLPGVWTVPDENAYPMEHAVAVAKEIAATYSNKTVHSAFALHYDYDDWGKARKVWRVVVTTALLRPVCVVNIDATTGEYISTHLSKEYSDKMLLSNPEKLELAVAEGTKVEILANKVNFRNKPNGGDITDSRIIARLDQGDVLTLLAEKLNGSTLWYYVSSPKHGEGYVNANFAQTIHNGQTRGASSPLTDNLLAYLIELRRWQHDSGFLTLDSSGRFVYTRNEALNTDAYREALVALMQKHSITATVGGNASFILANHYGTADLWDIFDPALEIVPGLRDEDWHANRQPTTEEQQRLADAFSAVDADNH